MRKVINKNLSFCKLIFKTFIGQPTGIILSFIAPLFVIIIITYLVNTLQNFFFDGIKTSLPEYLPKGVPEDILKTFTTPFTSRTVEFKITLRQILPGLLLFPTLIVCLLNIPMVMSTLKETKIFKKLKFLNINGLNIFLSIVFSFTLIILFSTVLLFLICKLIWWEYVQLPGSPAFLIPWFLMIFVSATIGFTIGNFFKNTLISFSVGVAFFLPTFFLSGIMFFQMEGGIFYLGKVLPQNHLVQLFRISWFENDLYVHDYQIPSSLTDHLVVKVNMFDQIWKDTLITYFYPLFWFVAFTSINSIFFRWE